MARNPKPIRKERKRLQAAARRGELTGPVPTYDQLARIRESKRAWRLVRQQVVAAWGRIRRMVSPIVSALLRASAMHQSQVGLFQALPTVALAMERARQQEEQELRDAAAALARRALEETSSATFEDVSGHPSGIRFGQPWQALSLKGYDDYPEGARDE